MTLSRKIAAPASAAVTGSDGDQSKDFSRSCADHQPPPTTAYQPPPLLRATSLRPQDPSVHRNQTHTTSPAVAAAPPNPGPPLQQPKAFTMWQPHATQLERNPEQGGAHHPTTTRRTSCQIRRPSAETPAGTTTTPSRRTQQGPLHDEQQGGRASLEPSTTVRAGRSSRGSRSGPHGRHDRDRRSQRRAQLRDQIPSLAPETSSTASQDASPEPSAGQLPPTRRNPLPRASSSQRSAPPPPAPRRLCLPEATGDGEGEKGGGRGGG